MSKPARKASASEGQRILAKNRKALHDYAIDERFEAGLVLQGSEVKSLRDGKVTLGDAYADIRSGELWLINAQVAVYPFAHQRNHEPLRDRKLLVHKQELRRLVGKVREKGYTLIPLSLYLKGPRVKVEIALARGRREYDKRDVIKEREQEREAAKAMRRR